jgi:hypothetical protein
MSDLEQRLREAVERFDARSPMGELLRAVLRRLSELEPKGAAWDTSPTAMPEHSQDEIGEAWRQAYLDRMREKIEAERRLSELEQAAGRVDEIYEGLRTDANDGTFALWSEDDLVAALHELGNVRRRAVLSREGNADE